MTTPIKKNILYIANLRLPTEKAYGIQIAKMCEAFYQTGLDVELVYPARKSHIRASFENFYGIPQKIKVTCLKAPDFYLPSKLAIIAFVIKNLISSVRLFFYALGRPADIYYSRDELTIVLLSFFRTNLSFEAHRFSSTRRFLYRRMRNAGIKIVVISKSIADRFIQDGFRREDILTAHDGVDIDNFNINVSKSESRRKLGLSQKDIIILYAGHLFSWKGTDVLAQAARHLTAITFVFVGGTEKDIKTFRKNFGILPNIQIIGQRPHGEVPLFLKAADVLVLPNSANQAISFYTSPLKLFEYMASGRPIVSSNLPSIAEILNKENAVLFNPGDIDALVDRIRYLLEHPEHAHSIALKALEDVKNYSWHNRAQRIINFLKKTNP